MIMCYGNYGTTLLLINAKLDHTHKSYLQFNQCQLFVPHEPLVILLSTTCTYALLYLLYWKNPGWVTDQDWIEDYREEY